VILCLFSGACCLLEPLCPWPWCPCSQGDVQGSWGVLGLLWYIHPVRGTTKGPLHLVAVLGCGTPHQWFKKGVVLCRDSCALSGFRTLCQNSGRSVRGSSLWLRTSVAGSVSWPARLHAHPLQGLGLGPLPCMFGVASVTGLRGLRLSYCSAHGGCTPGAVPLAPRPSRFPRRFRPTDVAYLRHSLFVMGLKVPSQLSTLSLLF
jgi:hypothetical protein